MSLESWKKEFCPPITKTVTRSQRSATEHCLRKWKGLLPENLEKHHCEIRGSDVCDKSDADKDWPDDRFWVDGSSCALCQKYVESDDPSKNGSCDDCPIFKLTGKECNGFDNSPFSVWCDNDDPKPMIKLLEKTLVYITSKSKK